MNTILLLAAVFTAANSEIVIPAQTTPVVCFAAQEAKTFLSQSLGGDVPIVHAPTDGKTSLVLGLNGWTEAEGLSTNALPRDAFTIAVKGERVYVFGRDDPKVDVAVRIANSWWGAHAFEHATLNGVYAFLEDAGIRFYFPGPLGTCVPSRTEIRLRDGVRTVAPDLAIRQWSYYSDGRWPVPMKNPKSICPEEKALNIYRLKASTAGYSCCHGLNGFRLIDRFKDTHPEYFALLKDGSRADHVINGEYDVGHLCYSSAVKDVIVADCLAYLRGESAASRGIKSIYNVGQYGWNHGTTPSNLDLMPQDGWLDCQCAACEAARRPKGEKFRSTELVWGFAADVARQLKAKGFEPIITLMSYADYADIPRIDLPTNIRPMVALTGPWAHAIPGRTEADVAYLKKWGEKLHGVAQPWVWLYPNKDACNALDLPDIPSFAPQAWGDYCKAVAPYVMGIFTESECDRFLNNFLGYYVVQKVCWDRQTDVATVIGEFYEKMFGAAVGPMRRALELIERKFVREIAADQMWTPVGPKTNRPSDYRLWTEIYSATVTAELEGHFDEAARAVPADSLEARRVALFRREFLLDLKARGDAYRAQISVADGLTRYRTRASANLVSPNWILDRPQADWDATVRLVGEKAIRVTTTEKAMSQWAAFNKLKPGVTLKPGQTYRLSWFVKTDLSPRERGGGAAMGVALAHKASGYTKHYAFPATVNYLSGKVDWIAQTVTFTVPADAPEGVTGCLQPFVRYAVGTTWFDGFLLEE